MIDCGNDVRLLEDICKRDSLVCVDPGTPSGKVCNLFFLCWCCRLF